MVNDVNRHDHVPPPQLWFEDRREWGRNRSHQDMVDHRCLYKRYISEVGVFDPPGKWFRFVRAGEANLREAVVSVAGFFFQTCSGQARLRCVPLDLVFGTSLLLAWIFVRMMNKT